MPLLYSITPNMGPSPPHTLGQTEQKVCENVAPKLQMRSIKKIVWVVSQIAASEQNIDTQVLFCFHLQGGSRPHVIFAKNEVRVTVFDDGNRGKDLPTGFSAEVEGILHLLLFHFQLYYFTCINRSNPFKSIHFQQLFKKSKCKKVKLSPSLSAQS